MFEKVIKTNIVLFFLAAGLLNFFVSGDQQFSYLSNSFLQGKTYFLQKPSSVSDTVLFEGKYYWPLQPFPAVILMPFVFLFSFFGKFFLQGYLQFFLAAGVFYLVYKISKKLGYLANDALFLAFAFCFSSVFLGVALWPWSWYFSQVIGTFLLFLGIYEFLTRKRYLFLGIISACIFLTRTPASLIIVLFISDLLFNSRVEVDKRKSDIIKLLLPFVLAVLLTFSYNFIRFKNIFEFGYNLQTIQDPTLKARGYGTFSLIHLSGNLYSFLLSPPEPIFKDDLSQVLTFPYVKANPWGMGIFFMSPYFLYLFFLKYKDRLLKLIWITVSIISIPIFLYYGVGYRQYGFRYSLDFLPLVFLILLIGYKRKYGKLSSLFKFIILTFAYINLYLFITFLSDFL